MTQIVKLISEEIQDVEYICEEKEDGKIEKKIERLKRRLKVWKEDWKKDGKIVKKIERLKKKSEKEVRTKMAQQKRRFVVLVQTQVFES